MAGSMNRRRFLRRAVWTIGATGLWPAAALGRSIDPAAARQARLIAGVFTRPVSAARIGRAYLRARPDDASLERLMQALAGGWPGGAAQVERLGTAQLRRRLQRRIRADFAAGRTVTVQGWVLAESEARLFGLAALAA
jgi:hypothetical protein